MMEYWELGAKCDLPSRSCEKVGNVRIDERKQEVVVSDPVGGKAGVKPEGGATTRRYDKVWRSSLAVMSGGLSGGHLCGVAGVRALLRSASFHISGVNSGSQKKSVERVERRRSEVQSGGDIRKLAPTWRNPQP